MCIRFKAVEVKIKTKYHEYSSKSKGPTLKESVYGEKPNCWMRDQISLQLLREWSLQSPGCWNHSAESDRKNRSILQFFTLMPSEKEESSART